MLNVLNENVVNDIIFLTSFNISENFLFLTFKSLLVTGGCMRGAFLVLTKRILQECERDTIFNERGKKRLPSSFPHPCRDLQFKDCVYFRCSCAPFATFSKCLLNVSELYSYVY